jgi:hypothetical protein
VQACEIFHELAPTSLHEGVDCGDNVRGRSVFELRSVDHAEDRLRPQPLGNELVFTAADKFAGSKIFFYLQQGADRARRTCNTSRLLPKKSHKGFCSRHRLLCGCKAPSMEVAQMMNFSFWFLKQSRLEVLHEPAKGASGFTKYLQDRLIVQYFVRSHRKSLAIKTPHHTATRPKKKLRTT